MDSSEQDSLNWLVRVVADKFCIGNSREEEDDLEECEEETLVRWVKSDHPPFKVETKVEISIFEGKLDA